MNSQGHIYTTIAGQVARSSFCRHDGMYIMIIAMFFKYSNKNGGEGVENIFMVFL